MLSAKKLKPIFKQWLPLGLAITLLCGLVYAAAQQDYRQSANDPQVQMAEDAALQLANVPDIQHVTFGKKIDISQSLAPYYIFFDSSGKIIVSQAVLDGQNPIVPDGVFAAVRQTGEKQFTWQPKSGVRSAVVVTRFIGTNTGFVLAGRSLRAVEKRVDRLQLEVAFGWASILCVTFVSMVLFSSKKK